MDSIPKQRAKKKLLSKVSNRNNLLHFGERNCIHVELFDYLSKVRFRSHLFRIGIRLYTLE